MEEIDKLKKEIDKLKKETDRLNEWNLLYYKNSKNINKKSIMFSKHSKNKNKQNIELKNTNKKLMKELKDSKDMILLEETNNRYLHERNTDLHRIILELNKTTINDRRIFKQEISQLRREMLTTSYDINKNMIDKNWTLHAANYDLNIEVTSLKQERVFLNNELDKLESKKNVIVTNCKCVICLDKEPIYVSSNCGHTLTCRNCDMYWTSNKCPDCRTIITSKIRIYLRN